MDKRVLTTVVICMGILFVWTKFFTPAPPKPAEPAAAPAAAAAAPTAPPEKRAPGDPAVETKAAAPTTPTAAAAPMVAAPRAPEEREPFEHAGVYRAVFTTWGGAPMEWTLLNPQFKETVVQPDGKKVVEPINLIRTSGAALPFIATFPQSDFTLPADAAWLRVPTPAGEFTYAWENEQVRVEKHFSFVPGTYEVKLKLTVENKSDKPLSEHLQLSSAGHQDPNVKPGGMFSQRFIQTEGECDVNGKLKHADLQSLLKKPLDEVGQVRWIGIDEKYFVAAIATAAIATEERRCWVSATTDGIISVNLLAAERKVAPKGKTEYEFSGYFGPKFLHLLDEVKVSGADARLSDAVNYGWTEAIARPMLYVLKAVHVAIPNWGIAIIVLTIALKAVTWWPTAKSMKSMREMARCKPEIDKLKAKYGDDKQKFNVAVMALYKERGINPLGGCLPMLIQMPIYIALYSMLGNSVELYRSGFVGWIQDLTSPDPYYVLPLLTGALMFAQQKTSPTPPDSQQKAMMYMMPVMFTAFSIFLPSGLTVYILTNTLLTMAQQLYLNRGDGPLGRPAAAKA